MVENPIISNYTDDVSLALQKLRPRPSDICPKNNT
jgi:hypothetical protein